MSRQVSLMAKILPKPPQMMARMRAPAVSAGEATAS